VRARKLRPKRKGLEQLGSRLNKHKQQAAGHFEGVKTTGTYLLTMAIRRFGKRLETDKKLMKKVKRLETMLLVDSAEKASL
jgi:thiazole synthase ThiGH ThiG subunit